MAWPTPSARARLLEPLVAAAPHDTGLRLQLSSRSTGWARSRSRQGDIAGSLGVPPRGARAARARAEAAQLRPLVRPASRWPTAHLADAQSEAADLAGALESHRRSLALRSELAKEFPENATYADNVATARYYLATTLGKLGRWTEALSLHQENLAQDPSARSSFAGSERRSTTWAGTTRR